MGKNIKRQLLEAKNNLTYNFLNHLVNKIPFWPLRRILYIIFGLKIGKGSYILRNVTIVSPKKIEIGNRTFVNEFCYLDGRSNIKIGDDVTVAIFSKIITGGHRINDESFSYEGAPVTIGNHVAIFADSLILGGAVLNDGCVISAKSLVRKGVYRTKGVYGGNPAIYLKERESTINYSQNSWKPIFR